MRHPDIIRVLIEIMQPKSYLELGIYEGETFEMANSLIARCVGVDIQDNRKSSIGEFHEMSTNDFFVQNSECFDMIFIDADHSIQSVREDLYEALICLNDLGIIILHDTDPARKALVDPGYCGDAYKINEVLTQDTSLMHMVLPVHEEGITIIRRANSQRVKI
jgi:predicted O-methyltransferase YrrM